MTEELKQAISALQCAKRGHCDHAMADEAIAALEALTQRPAAQTEREAFEEWWESDGPNTSSPYEAAMSAWEAGRASLPAPQQATPEPVGEALQFPPMPEGWPARFRCDSCDGNGEIGELVSMGDFQPPERQTCPDCGGRGWTSEEHAFNADHMREFAEAHALLTRPAPGVPEDVQRDAERLDWLTFNISGKALRDIGVMWGEHANARAAIDAAMLAAAQAKGWQ